MSLHCSVCSTENPDGTTYCEGCGVELSSSPTPPAPEIPAPPPLPEETTPDFPPIPQDSPQPTPPGPSPEEIPPPPFPMPPGGTASLVLKIGGALTSDRFDLLGERHTVGKFDPSLGPIEIDLTSVRGSEYVSRRHAEIYREGGRWFIKDLGSTNGIFIRRSGEGSFSSRLVEPAPLAHGDEVALGNLMLVFQET